MPGKGAEPTVSSSELADSTTLLMFANHQSVDKARRGAGTTDRFVAGRRRFGTRSVVELT